MTEERSFEKLVDLGFDVRTMPSFSDDERHLLINGYHKDCVICDKAKQSLEEKGYQVPDTWLGLLQSPNELLKVLLEQNQSI